MARAKKADAQADVQGVAESESVEAVEAQESVTVELVKMVRDAELYDEPHQADVAVDEVENYKVGGWTLAE